MKNTLLHINKLQIVKKCFFLTVSFVLLFSCVEEIDLRNFNSINLLIVQAELTDELKQHTIKLSRTIPLDSATPKNEISATVHITDNLGNTYLFSEFEPGSYKSTTAFKAEMGNLYKLHIQTLDGEVYESEQQKITGKNNISDLYVIPDKNISGELGVSIIVESNNENTTANYYKYTYEETYIVKAPYWSTDSLKIISANSRNPILELIKKPNNALERRICYKTIFSNTIIQTETNSLSTSSVKYAIRFIAQKNSIIWHRYSMLAIQHIQSYEAYTYYKILNKLSTDENVFSQVQPGYLQGNIFPTKDTDNTVIGFFEVNSVSKKRFFFNFSDIYPVHNINFQGDCLFLLEWPFLIDPLNNANEAYGSPLIAAITYFRLVYAKENGSLERPYFVVPIQCTDCRYAASNIKPPFWID